MVLLSGGHLKRLAAQGALFALAAVFTGGLTGATIAGVGGFVPGTSTRAAAAVLLLGCVWALAWYIAPGSIRLPTPKKQLTRRYVEVPLAGAALFGGVLGVGVLTVVATPLVWTGLAAAAVSGSALTGLIYGTAFGLGRSVQLLQQRLHRPAAFGEIAVRVTSRTHRYRLGGAVYSACLAGVAAHALI